MSEKPKTHRERAGEAAVSNAEKVYRLTFPTELVQAAREFVRKVETGEARSVRSYAAFKAALSLYEEKP